MRERKKAELNRNQTLDQDRDRSLDLTLMYLTPIYIPLVLLPDPYHCHRRLFQRCVGKGDFLLRIQQDVGEA